MPKATRARTTKRTMTMMAMVSFGFVMLAVLCSMAVAGRADGELARGSIEGSRSLGVYGQVWCMWVSQMV